MIEVNNLTKKYGDHVAVDNLSFTVEKGQILGFLGPNGAGKSTTMNMITGYISATEGSVTICGHDIFEEPEEAKKCIGYLPELPPLYHDMTVKEYLKFVAGIKKVKKQEVNEMLDKVMKLAMVDDVSGRLIKFLSKGYKQRVGLAGALVGFPEVLILDEPTVGLDPAQITWVRDLIKELSKDHAIILSSHILSEISAICDRVIIINKGKLIVSDTPDNLTRHTENSNALKLEVRASRAQIEEAVATISDINHVDYEKEEDGSTFITIYSESDKDIREEVFYTFSKEKCPILMMNSYTMSLEDIFLLVTGKTSDDEIGKEKNQSELNDESIIKELHDIEQNEVEEDNNASNI